MFPLPIVKFSLYFLYMYYPPDRGLRFLRGGSVSHCKLSLSPPEALARTVTLHCMERLRLADHCRNNLESLTSDPILSCTSASGTKGESLL